MKKKKVKAPPEQAQTAQLTNADRDRIETYKARLRSTPSLPEWTNAGKHKGTFRVTNDLTKGEETSWLVFLLPLGQSTWI
jgi:hypothetical protein